MIKKILFAGLAAVLMVGCGGGSKSKREQKRDARAFHNLITEYTGQEHTLEKRYTEVGKYAVYRNSQTGEFVAYNLGKFDRHTMFTMEDYLANNVIEGTDIVYNLEKESIWIEDGYWREITETQSGWESVYDSYCDCYTEEYVYYEVVVGHDWVDTSYWAHYYHGGGFTFDSTSPRSKDLEMLEGLKEDAAQEFIAYKLQSDYSLSSTRASELAQLVIQSDRLENARELTAAEKNFFATESLGMSAAEVENAVKQKAEGRDEAYAKLLETAAQVNKTSPEQIGKFFEEYILD